MSRRQVRVDQSFFDRLDELFPVERTDDGRPSATDIVVHEVPTVVDLLAEDFLGVTVAVEAAAPVRVLVTAWVLVRHLAVYAVLRPDDVVAVIYLDADG